MELICPYYLSWGMTYDEFWYGSPDRLQDYYQAHLFQVEQRNQELWMQGLYIRIAVASCLDKNSKYPERPQRVTALTELEQELENKRRLEEFKNYHIAAKQRWDARQNARQVKKHDS